MASQLAATLYPQSCPYPNQCPALPRRLASHCLTPCPGSTFRSWWTTHSAQSSSLLPLYIPRCLPSYPALPCPALQYIEFVGDQLAATFGYERTFKAPNPFNWLETIALK